MGFWSDLGDAVSSVVSTVGDVVEDVVDTVVDTVEDVVDAVVDTVQEGLDAAADWANDHLGGFLGGVANVVLGGISGWLEGVQDLVHDVLDIVRDVVAIVGAILRLDFAAVIDRLVDLVIHVVDLFIDWVRFVTFGYVVGGIVHAFQRSGLKKFVEGLLEERFSGDPLAAVRDRLGMDGTNWGFPLKAEHRVARMDSATLPLWQMHLDGDVDLYALAGLLSFDSFQLFPRPRTLVRTVTANGNDSLFPVNRLAISSYIESQGEEGRLRVYALSREATADNLRIAREKCRKIRVKLDWNDGEKFSWFRGYTTHDLTSGDDFFFDPDTQGRYLPDHGLRTGRAEDNCTLLALAVFRYDDDSDGNEQFGLTTGRTIRENDAASPCATAGRTDACCSTLDLTEGSGVTYRDLWPSYVFRYVLPHEIGHYLGLCHAGHDGFQNLMWKPDPDAGLGPVSWGTFSFYYESEPHFTYEDARNAWRFIVSQLMICVGVENVGTVATGAQRGPAPAPTDIH
jgi:hypothetical protein